MLPCFAHRLTFAVNCAGGALDARWEAVDCQGNHTHDVTGLLVVQGGRGRAAQLLSGAQDAQLYAVPLERYLKVCSGLACPGAMSCCSHALLCVSSSSTWLACRAKDRWQLVGSQRFPRSCHVSDTPVPIPGAPSTGQQAAGAAAAVLVARHQRRTALQQAAELR